MNNLFTRFSSTHAKSVTINSKLFRTIISLKSRNIYFSNNSIYNFQWAEIFSAKQPTRWAHSSIVQNVFSCSDSHRRFMSSFWKSNDNQRSHLSPDLRLIRRAFRTRNFRTNEQPLKVCTSLLHQSLPFNRFSFSFFLSLFLLLKKLLTVYTR